MYPGVATGPVLAIEDDDQTLDLSRLRFVLANDGP
jgi:hypothetical protein